VLKAFES